MSTEPKTDVTQPTTPPLSEILATHAKLEAQVGEIYVMFAATFGHNPELRTLWSEMALEEGGHAALLRAVNKGFLAGAFHVKSILLPLEMLEPLTTQIAEYHRQALAGASLDQALRITWELECSELDFMRELLASSSNLAELGFPTPTDSKDRHIGRLRAIVQQYATDPALRREVRFLSAERLPR